MDLRNLSLMASLSTLLSGNLVTGTHCPGLSGHLRRGRWQTHESYRTFRKWGRDRKEAEEKELRGHAPEWELKQEWGGVLREMVWNEH